MSSLYDIAQDILALGDALIEGGGEITEELEAFEKELKTALVEKTDNIVSLAQSFEDQIEVAKKHEKRIREYRQARENAIKRLKAYALDAMTAMDVKKLKGELFEIAQRAPVDVVNITDESKIPAEYTRVIVEVLKADVKKALKAGEDVPGASLSKGKASVQFKLKSGK